MTRLVHIGIPWCTCKKELQDGLSFKTGASRLPGTHPEANYNVAHETFPSMSAFLERPTRLVHVGIPWGTAITRSHILPGCSRENGTEPHRILQTTENQRLNFLGFQPLFPTFISR